MDELLHSKSPLITVSSIERKYKARSKCSTSNLDICFEDEKPIHSKFMPISFPTFHFVVVCS